jgi:hypothetical protein
LGNLTPLAVKSVVMPTCWQGHRRGTAEKYGQQIRRAVQAGVVLVVVVLACGILIHLIRTARIAAYRTHCINNLKQICLAASTMVTTGGTPCA